MSTSSYKKGLLAEYFCMLYLFFCGYRVLEHRYKTKLGEIDLIACRNKQLAFIEVKARDSKDKAAYSVQKKSMRRIENTAKSWLSNNSSREFEQISFDVLTVTSLYKKPKWYKNAWQVT